ncbi:NADPH oxidase organizer 1a [Gadus morhua]|uniref:NADPH oxidase organizer 1a n=1 Tax=Gadus morhua TaxID=8049 RepID=A0A8C5BN02_GADMO|nr:NADPH oxidase organizer 1 [Gadus morhua]
MDEQRYPISVRLIGIMHNENGKNYITSVLWSDQNEIVVYRGFLDFKKMHKQMKKAFPSNALKKSSRIIPKFKDHNKRGGGQKKGASRSVLRLKSLEKYCQELLSCDPRVTQSLDLIKFFHPTAQDLEPEYASNSIMVMPSEEGIGERNQGREHSVGNVTQPFVTETYHCVASYETKDTKNKPFKVAVDEKVDVLIKDKAGWWLVENEDKRLAWFPAPYLEKLEDGEDDEDDTMDSPTGIGALYTSVKSYKAANRDEVSVNIGSVVEVLQKSDNGWWFVRSGDKVGYVPTLYLQPHNNPRNRMVALQQDLRGSNVNLSQLQAPSLDGYNLSKRSHSHGDVVPLSQLQAPSLGGDNPKERSHSQGDILQLPSTAIKQRLGDDQRSNSMELQDAPGRVAAPSLPPKPYMGNASSPTAAPLPVIRVDSEEDDHRYRSHTLESQESIGSFASDSSDFSFSDRSSNGSPTLNLGQSLNEQQLRLSRTPQPPTMSSNRLSPNTGKMTPSVSDPNLFKGPTTPKVPPRPRAEEILTRCTTVTRKNASMGKPAPTLSDIQSY